MVGGLFEFDFQAMLNLSAFLLGILVLVKFAQSK
jgi:hypothetical protein